VNRVFHKPLRAVATVHNGVRYDSKTEARRAGELDMLQRAGQIRFWLRQTPVRLDVVTYKPDFFVCEKDGSSHFEDVKGCITREFRRIARLWQAHGPADLHVIHGKNLEVIVPDAG
jgi:hypothetical protein